MAVVLGTWPFSEEAVRLCIQALADRSSVTDAVVNSIAAVEEDESMGVYVVGCGGYPNNAGRLQCDAAIMNGDTCTAGAVAAIEGVSSPISVARAVLQNSPHSMLVGEGAQQFAKQQGFDISKTQLSPMAEKAWQEYKTKHSVPGKTASADPTGKPYSGFDTLGILALDSNGHLAAGVSTSGMPFKSPGRVGDSALTGSGLYADSEVGAACCTGDGDDILRFCPSYHVVQLMRQGQTPQQACDDVISHIRSRVMRMALKVFEVAVIALNKKGEVGASSTIEQWRDDGTGQVYDGFPYVSMKQGDSAPKLNIVPGKSTN